LILPDATYLERYDIEEGVGAGQIAEYALRQPLIAPRGEARDFKDVCCELAKMLGIKLGFKSGEDFVKKACKRTRIVKKKARGFRGLKKRGVWHDKKAEPAYYGYRQLLDEKALSADGVIRDEATGVYWNWKAAGATSEALARSAGYGATPGAAAGYIGQQVEARVVRGFEPSLVNKTGLFELFTPTLGLPGYAAIPDHIDMRDDQLILTTFKVNVQAMSNTGNGGWLNEILHINPLWINPRTAAARGIAEGDAVTVKSRIGNVAAVAMVTPTVAPGVVALASHLGRWQGGRYAAGKRAPFAADDDHHDQYQWWPAGGVHANWIIPDSPEPVSGQQCWMDTVVTVART